MAIAVGTQVRNLVDDLSHYTAEGDWATVPVGTVGEAVEMTDRFNWLKSVEDEFVVAFPGGEAGEGIFYAESEEGTAWERA
jgi:hypothetical protein